MSNNEVENKNRSIAKILVDADACPMKVRSIVEAKSREHGLKLIFVTDINHEIQSRNGEVIVVDQGHDSVDMAIINEAGKSDIVVTQDYGLASLVLAKGAKAIHPSGRIFDDNNIDMLLMDRHLAAKSRKAGERVARHRKRERSDDFSFASQFEKFFS